VRQRDETGRTGATRFAAAPCSEAWRRSTIEAAGRRPRGEVSLPRVGWRIVAGLRELFGSRVRILRVARAFAPLARTRNTMKGDAKVIDLLNEVLTNELTAINQYFLHSRMCRNWGYHRLAARIHKEAIDEMKHADELIERVLFLEGLPNVQRLGKVLVGQTVPEILKNDLALERVAVPALNKGMQLCRDTGDNGSEDLLREILTSEEEHVDWLEAQHDLLQQVGEQNYLAQQIHGDK
jgi:bacterioferritin